MPHLVRGTGWIVTQFNKLVYLLAKLSKRLKLHNVPGVLLICTFLPEQPGAFFSHQDMSFWRPGGSITVIYDSDFPDTRKRCHYKLFEVDVSERFAAGRDQVQEIVKPLPRTRSKFVAERLVSFKFILV